MMVRIIALVGSIVLGFIFPAPLTLLAAGVMQDNLHLIWEETFGKPNLILAYRFSAPFVAVFALAIAGFGFHQCSRTTRPPRHTWFHTGFLLLGATFGASSLLAFQLAFGGGITSAGDVIGLVLLGAADGALCALPVSILWFFIVRRKVHLESLRAAEEEQLELAHRVS
jgi:hypothetical protein